MDDRCELDGRRGAARGSIIESTSLHVFEISLCESTLLFE